MDITITCSSWEELRELARNISGTDRVEIGLNSITIPAPVTPLTIAEEAQKPEPAQDPEPEPEAPVEATAEAPAETASEAHAYTKPEVRAYLGALRKAGKKEAVSKLIRDMGYQAFTDIPEDRFEELMEKAREL